MRVRLSAGVGCAVLVALLVAPGAAVAGSVPARMQAAIDFIAGHPVTVACDANVNPSPFPVAPGYIVAAWTLTGGDTIHALPLICDETSDPVGSPRFADGVATMIHEAARAHGWQSDSCVEMLADVGVYDVLRRFYDVPFFNDMSERVGSQVLALTRRRPASYQPEACWASGTMR